MSKSKIILSRLRKEWEWESLYTHRYHLVICAITAAIGEGPRGPLF